MWNADHYPQEFIVDTVDPTALEPLEAKDLVDPWNVRVDVIAKRLNDLLVIVQQQHEQIERLQDHHHPPEAWA